MAAVDELDHVGQLVGGQAGEEGGGEEPGRFGDYLNSDTFQYVSSVILFIAAISTSSSEFFISLACSSSIAARTRSA